MIKHAAVVTTRSLDVVTRELDELRARRDLLGNEDSVSRWRREGLEMEQARARDREKSRNLTDHEAVRQVEHLQQLVAAESAAINARITNQEKLFTEALGEAFAKERRKSRDELKRNVDEQVTKLKTGPQGQRGMKGDRGEYGARGPEGKTGPQGPRGMTGAKGEYGACGPQGKEGQRGKPGATIVKWEIDRKNYSLWPVMSDDSTGPELQLRQLFEQFLLDVKGRPPA